MNKNPRQDIVFKTSIQNQELNLHSTWGLFSPTGLDEGTELLLKSIKIGESDTSLDIGCGYGVIGLTLAKISPRGTVHMVDKDFVAVEFAKKNAQLNKISNCQIYLSNGLQNVPKEVKFDNIISNLPANVGKEMFGIIFEDVKEHLKPGGKFFVVTISGLKEFIKRNFKEYFGNYDKLGTSKTYTAAVAIKES